MSSTPPTPNPAGDGSAGRIPVSHVGISVEPVHSALVSLAMLSRADTLPGLNRWVVETAAALSPERRHANRLVFHGLADALAPDAGSDAGSLEGIGHDALGREDPDRATRPADRPGSAFPTYLAALAACDPLVLRDRALEGLRARFARAQAASGTGPSGPADARRLLDDVDAYLTGVRLAGGPDSDDRALHMEAHALLRDPVGLRAMLVEHLSALWEAHLADEWRRIQPKLDWQARMFTHALAARALAADAGDQSPAGAFRWVAGRDLPSAALRALTGVPRVILVPTWHVGRQVFVAVDDAGTNRGHDRGHDAVARVYFSEPPNYDVTMMRAAAVGSAELRARLAALADETRLRILALCANRDELTAQEIIADLELSQSNVSRHLKQLVEAGYLYERRGAGANKTYRLSAFYFDRAAGAVERLALPPEIASTVPGDERGAAALPGRRGTGDHLAAGEAARQAAGPGVPGRAL